MADTTVAFILTGNHINNFEIISDDVPGCMVSLLDRPWLQHMVEAIVKTGVKTIHLFNCDSPLHIESYFQSGKRWGIDFVYHLARDEKALLKQVELQAKIASDCNILLAEANCIFFEAAQLSDMGDNIIFKPSKSDNHNHFWHLVSADSLQKAAKFNDYKSLSEHLSSKQKNIIECQKYLVLENPADLIEAQKTVMTEALPVLCNANEVDPGVWISRNVSLAPTAIIAPPIFIGENAQISTGAKIGPNACIGVDCIIDSSTTISNSCVFSGTYVGEALNISNSIVNQSQLLNLDINGKVNLSEDFMLASMRTNSLFDTLEQLFWRIFALFIAVIFLPLMLTCIIVKKVFSQTDSIFYKKLCITTPANPDSPVLPEFVRLSLSSASLSNRKKSYHSIAHFILEVLPSLPAVITGKTSLVGLQNRSQKEFEQLSKPHKKLFLKSKTGLITENQVNFDGIASDQELFAAEALHSAKYSFSYNMKLFLGYFISFFIWPK